MTRNTRSFIIYLYITLYHKTIRPDPKLITLLMVKHQTIVTQVMPGCWYHQDASGPWDTYQIMLWFLQGNNINNNKVIHYNIMHIYQANCVMVKDFSAGTPNGFCRGKCVLHVLLPGYLVIAGILYSN